MYGRRFNGPGVQFGPPVTPPVVKNLMIAIAVVYVIQVVTRDQYTAALTVVPELVWQQGWLWQPFTYMWLHGGLMHAALNCFVLWMFGSQMAMAWGDRRFLQFYLICGVGAGFIISLWPYVPYALGMSSAHSLQTFTLGASGAVYGVMLAYSLTWPDRQIMLIFPPVAFRAIWLIPITFAMTYLADPRGEMIRTFGNNNRRLVLILLIANRDRIVSWIGHNHIRARNRIHHSLLGHLALHLTHSLAQFRAAFSFFMLIANLA